ncbi:O-antigen ligase [Arthrobacter sp. CAN_A214]|uniref:O-antigen ligase family protein n=1 Tax=Arthrobacter sp. CAN_A214 TaxID=2787720 RepID=UPI0018CBC527
MTAKNYGTKPKEAPPKRDLALLAMAFLVLVLPFSEALPGSVRLMWNALIFMLFLGCLLTVHVKRPVGGGWWVVVSTLVLISIVSSSGRADSLSGHLIVGLQIWMFVTVGPFVIRYLVSLDGGARSLGGAFLLGQSISSAAAVAQATGISTFNQAVLYGRSTGLAGHPNILGVLSGMAVLMLTAALVGRSNRKALVAVLLLLNVAALIASGSISSMIATLMGFLIFLVAARVPLKALVLITGTSVLALWILSSVASEGLLRGPLERFRQVTGQTTNIGTLDAREQTYQYAWEGIQRDPWFGRGLDQISGLTGDQRTVTHNVILRTWFQGGLALGLAYAVIAVLIIWIALGALRRGRDAVSASLLIMAASFSLTSAALEQAYYWLPVLGALALVEPKDAFLDSTKPQSPVMQRQKSLNISRRWGA